MKTDIEQQLAENAVDAIIDYLSLSSISEDDRRYLTTHVLSAIVQGQIEYLKTMSPNKGE